MKIMIQLLFILVWMGSANAGDTPNAETKTGSAVVEEAFPKRQGLFNWTPPTKNTDNSDLTNLGGYLLGYHLFDDSESICRPPDKIRYLVDVGTNLIKLGPEKVGFKMVDDPNFRINGKYYVVIYAYSIPANGKCTGGVLLDIPGQPKRCLSDPTNGICLTLNGGPQMDNGPQMANAP